MQNVDMTDVYIGLVSGRNKQWPLYCTPRSDKTNVGLFIAMLQGNEKSPSDISTPQQKITVEVGIMPY